MNLLLQEKLEKNQETVALCTEKEILSDLSSHFSLETELNKKSEDGTSLTTTWRLCKPALQSEVIPETQSHVQQTFSKYHLHLEIKVRHSMLYYCIELKFTTSVSKIKTTVRMGLFQ